MARSGSTSPSSKPRFRLGAPFVAVVADDRAWGIVASGQRARYGREGVLASGLGPMRYDLVAEACGAIGVRAETLDEVSTALRAGLRADRPTLVQVPITPDRKSVV